MSYAPMLDCPACGKEVQIDDYYEMDEGTEIECPNCDTMLVCERVEMLMYWSWKSKECSETKVRP